MNFPGATADREMSSHSTMCKDISPSADSALLNILFEQATKVNCPGATADGENVLAFNNVTGSCDWAVNVPGCGGERCNNVKLKNYKIFLALF